MALTLPRRCPAMSSDLAARGESLAAFDGRCIPAGCVAPRSNTPGILGRRALPSGRLARLGATPDFRHGLLGFTHGAAAMMSVVFAVYLPTCGTTKVMPSAPASEVSMAQLWQRPDDLASRDLFYGPWGEKLAPDAQTTYTFVKKKQQGTNPGVTVTDPLGHE